MFLTGCAAFRSQYDNAMQHPQNPTLSEVAWFRAHPEARVRLLNVLTDSELPDNDSSRVLAWSLMKQKVLTNAEIGQIINQAFNLIVLPSEKVVWWVFERRTAPEFVYIRPQMSVYLKNGWVTYAESINTPGNGVEVHPASSGRGPFSGLIPLGENNVPLADEFRLYYKVVSAPTMPWLEGYESFLKLALPTEIKINENLKR